RIVQLNISAIVAGTKYRGQFESRMKAIIKEAASCEDIILFIDELHTLVGAGAAEGSVDAANMLKPALARGEIKVIGATTLSEYRKHIEKDGALERRFQIVLVEPPTKEDTILILKGLRRKYEEYHGVKITDEAIESAVRLSERYITSKFLPDKAIDLIDEACAMVKVRNYVLPEEIREAEVELDRIVEEKRRAMEEQDLEKVTLLRGEESRLIKRLRDLKREWKSESSLDNLVVTEDDVALVASRITGIPLTRISESEEKKLLTLEDEMKKYIVGQDEAIEKIARAIKRSRSGLRVVTRPIGVFFFLGPTGVGKTRTAEVLAELLFGTKDALIRVDMSEYMERFNVSRLIGAPPGYVGYEEGGQLTEAVRRRPYSVILFDEIEKAHPDVFNLLLQIFDSGRLTDAYGRVVDFRNTVIIMTSNIGAKGFFRNVTLGFKDEDKSLDSIKAEVMSAFKKRFPPEFINRLDDVIIFNPLTKEHMFSILEIILNEVKEMVSEKGYELVVTERAKAFLVKKGYNPQLGARPLRRAVDRYLVDPLSEEVIAGAFPVGSIIVADSTGNDIRFRRKTGRKGATV
ncbi:MAG: ATP-dependent Clp protease ATP-binding subunit, partial [Thermosulfidibacteraceae bacterium]